MTDELQNIYLPKFDDNDEMYFDNVAEETFDFSHYIRPKFDDNDKMYFDEDEIYLEAIA